MDDQNNEFQMTRRQLLKWMGLSAGVVFTGPLSGCKKLWRRQPVIPVEKWHRAVCRFCGTGCAIQVGVKDGEIVDVKGDEFAHNQGRLCIKGALTRYLPYVKDRATHPLVRKNGKLEKTSWEEAMKLVASRFREAIEKKGKDSVAFYGSGQLYTQESYAANKLFKAGIGTNNVDGNPRLCMASAAVGYIAVYGKDEPLGCYEDIDFAHSFFITGSNTAECHPVLWERIKNRKASNPNTFITVVDPRRTKTAERADLFLQIKPGTDITLYNSMIYELIERDFIDREMVEKYLTFKKGSEKKSFEDLVAHVKKYSPEKAAETCGVAPADIKEAAYHFGASKATMSLWTMGINQQSQGSAANRLLNAMHLLTGQVGRPGATPMSLTGQPNACGGVRDTGALAHALPNSRLVTKKKHRREMEKLWKVPEGTISAQPGHHAVGLFEAMGKGDVECCLIMCTNPGHSLPNASKYHKAMEKAFTVVADSIYPTETTKYADVVLPAAMWVEKGPGVMGQTDRRYQRLPVLVDPPGEARSDLEILIDLAHRLGHKDLFPNDTYEALWDEWREISAHSKYNFKGITMERMKKEYALQWPCPSEDHPGTKRRFVPGEDPMAKKSGRLDFYGRPDRRAVIWLHDQEDPREPRDEEYPLVLTTGRILEHWHTMTMTGQFEDLEDIHPDYVEVHPLDARKYKLKEGQKVMVKSRRGEASFEVKVTRTPRPGVVFTTFHSPKHLINLATKDVYDPFSKEPEYKICACRIEPIQG